MSNGSLFSKVQPLNIGGGLLNIIESDRQRRLAGRDAKAKQLAKDREDLFKGFEKLDSEGDFLASSVQSMNEARRAKVALYNSKAQGQISDTDYLLASSKIDQIPLLLNSAYQSTEETLTALGEGDKVLNNESLNRLMVATNGVGLKYNPKTNDLDVSFNYLDDDGKKQRKTLPRQDFVNEVLSVDIIPEQGDPLEIADSLGRDFEADLIQSGRVTDKGLAVGGSLERLEKDIVDVFGEKDIEDNLLVEKAMAQGQGENYADTWQHLHDSVVAKVPSTHRRTPTPQPRAVKEVDPNKDLDKMNWRILSEGGKAKVAETKILTSDGEVVGIGGTFKMSDSGQKFDLGAGSLEGIPSDVAETIKVDAIFISDSDDIYIKGSANQISELQRLVENSELPESEQKEAIKILGDKRKKNVDWLKVSGDGAENIMSNIFGARSPRDMAEFLESVKLKQFKETKKGKFD